MKSRFRLSFSRHPDQRGFAMVGTPDIGAAEFRITDASPPQPQAFYQLEAIFIPPPPPP